MSLELLVGGSGLWVLTNPPITLVKNGFCLMCPTIQHRPKCMSCHKASDNWESTLFSWLHILHIHLLNYFGARWAKENINGQLCFSKQNIKNVFNYILSNVTLRWARKSSIKSLIYLWVLTLLHILLACFYIMFRVDG